MMASRDHWERIYRANTPEELSWYQREARISLDLIRRAAPDTDTPVLDVGGGASVLVDDLLDAGYRTVTVLDLAPSALAMAGRRLGERARQVSWISGDVLTTPLAAGAYGVWHDRAVFHFLLDPADRARYVEQSRRAVRPGGHLIVASFAPEGPLRCSGLEVARYSPEAMKAEFGRGFKLLESEREEHRTPSGVVQSFVYCLCRLEE